MPLFPISTLIIMEMFMELLSSHQMEYKLTGIIELEVLMPIQVLIDRAYPEYIVGKDDSLRNYAKFIHSNGSRGNLKIEKAIPGSKSQIKLLKNNTYDFQPGQETYYKMISKDLYSGPRDIFATYIFPETKKTYGRWFVEGYKSMAGHIVIRVMPGGSEYYVYILDHTKLQVRVIDKFGPYKSQ